MKKFTLILKKFYLVKKFTNFAPQRSETIFRKNDAYTSICENPFEILDM